MKEIIPIRLCSPLFQVQGVYRRTECTGGRRSLEAAFRRKLGCGFGRDFCITCIRNCTF